MKDAVQDLLDEVTGWQPYEYCWTIDTTSIAFNVKKDVKDMILAEWAMNKSDVQHQIHFVDAIGGECVVCVGALLGAWETTPELRRRSRLQCKFFDKEKGFDD